MRSEQIKEYFEKRDEYPSVGFYFDIDYWQKPDKELDVDSILRIIKPFSEQGWEKHEKIRALVVEVP